ncbi:MAG TPA: efflux RND transporter periplasmic adaptor subunit [Polyangiaceae bacterium]|nr:efflux RND transporter periplasmic adaptor subunit [Polyangiaceae bacterium]
MRLTVPLTLAAAALLSALGGYALQRRPASGPTAAPSVSAAAQSAPVPVDFVTVQLERFETGVQATGTLLARESVELVSELNRRLVKVRAEEGAQVKKGQVLFELDAADLNAQLAQLAVQARLAKVTLERNQKLSSEGLSTQAELETAQANLDAAEAQRRVLGVTLSKTVIRAPFDGKLGLRRVSEGAWLSPSTVLATLQDTSTLKLDYTLPERYAGLVAVGSEFGFKITGSAEVFKGKVLAQEPAVDKATRSILVRAVVGNHPSLLPGTFVTVEVPLRADQALLVPAMVVLPDVEGRRVFVEQNGVARSVQVEVGARTTDRVQILSGLEPGDRVVVSNLLRVRNGSKLKLLGPEAK